jgi:hypothetical protein
MAKYEYEIKNIDNIQLIIYEDGDEIYNSETDSTLDIMNTADDLKTEAIYNLENSYPDIKNMTVITNSSKNESIVPSDVTKLTIPVLNPSSKGVNVEKTALFSKEAQDKILKNQDKNKKELKESVPVVSMSDELSKTKLSDLGLSKSQIPRGVDLSKVSLKNILNTNKINLSTYDLSTLKKSDLNINLLLGLGFSILTISTLTDLIKNEVKSVDKETKQKRISTTTNNITSDTTPNVMGSDDTKYNNIDQYSKKRSSAKKRINDNKNYTADQKNRGDVLNSQKAITTKKRTILYKDNPNYGKYHNNV